MTPYLKGNVAGPCPKCSGSRRDPERLDGICRACKARGIVGKPVDQVIAETLGREWVAPDNDHGKEIQ